MKYEVISVAVSKAEKVPRSVLKMDMGEDEYLYFECFLFIFSDFGKSFTDGPTNRRTDGPTDGHTLLQRCVGRI